VRKRLIEAEEAVTKMRDEAEAKEFIAKAKTLGVGDADKIGGLLLRVTKSKTTAEDAALLESMLKAAGSQEKTAALFKSLGSDTAVDSDPEALLKAKAEEIAKASGGKLTKEQAYAKAMDENPGLYGEFLAKRRAA
jgi:hypothetical protein